MYMNKEQVKILKGIRQTALEVVSIENREVMHTMYFNTLLEFTDHLNSDVATSVIKRYMNHFEQSWIAKHIQG